MVFPVIGIIKIINPRYSSGICTSPNNGKARSESYAPSKIIGSAAIARVTGLNQPPITFLSSTYPIRNAAVVVIIIARISLS